MENQALAELIKAQGELLKEAFKYVPLKGENIISVARMECKKLEATYIKLLNYDQTKNDIISDNLCNQNK